MARPKGKTKDELDLEVTDESLEEEMEEHTNTELGLTPEEALNERVPFFAIKDNDRYSNDIVVTINGKTTIIQRGHQVEIPAGVRLVLVHSNRQAIESALMNEELSKNA